MKWKRVSRLKNGKSYGHDRLSAEHFKYSSHKLYYLLAMLLNSMLIHGYLPDDFMLTHIIPIVKNKKGDITSKDNYRPIAITSVSSKVFELILIARYSDYLDTSHNQFGYKEKTSSHSCIFVLKEIVNYYRRLPSNVYICFLDASKAFDRIKHYHLLKM